MKSRLFLFVAIPLVLISGTVWFVYQMLIGVLPTPGATATPMATPPAQTAGGEATILVSPAAQLASHIEVAPLSSTTMRAESTAYATVIDLQAFFSLRSQLLAAQASLDSLEAQANHSRAQYERSRLLFKDNRNVSEKSLQDAHVLLQTDHAKLRSAQATRSDLEATLRQTFGTVLARTAMTADSALFQRLLEGRTKVLRVTLPAGAHSSAPPQITVDGPSGPVSANLLSVSPQADPTVQGIPYLYITESPLPIGIRTIGHIPETRTGAPATLIPDRAVVWYGGQPWVYLRTAPDQFARRYVPATDQTSQGFAVTGQFQTGDQVVVQGAQLLLSQELRPQGVATVCKDPPECDD